jgi:hypothetical protein
MLKWLYQGLMRTVSYSCLVQGNENGAKAIGEGVVKVVILFFNGFLLFH